MAGTNAGTLPATIEGNLRLLQGAARTFTVNDSLGMLAELVINAAIAEAVPGTNLNKVGPGALVLGGALGYTGDTSVQAGGLFVNGTAVLTNDFNAAVWHDARRLRQYRRHGHRARHVEPGRPRTGHRYTQHRSPLAGPRLHVRRRSQRPLCRHRAANGYDQVNVTGSVTIDPTSILQCQRHGRRHHRRRLAGDHQ